MNILICNASTYGNKGDDIIRDIIVDHLSKFPNVNIKVTRPYPQRELVEWADKVIIGGGGILYDQNGSDHGQANFDYFIKKYLTWSNELNKPVCLCGIGIQGLGLEENIEYLRKQLEKVSFVSARQQEDKDFFDKHNLYPNTIVADDIGFLTQKSSYTFTLPRKNKVCLVVSRIPFEETEWLVHSLKQLGYELHVTTTAYEDIDLVEKISNLIGEYGSVRNYNYLSPSEYVSLFSEMDIVITGRFHGAVFAHAAGVKKIFHVSRNYKLSNLFDLKAQLRSILETKNISLLQETLKHENLLKFNNNSSIHLDLLTNFINK